ncbi:MAG: hypothetical protein ACHQET_06755, partial [Chitinophagales bacterium]
QNLNFILMKRMNIKDFKASFSNAEPPADLTVHAKALWYAGKREWDRAHQIIQEQPDKFSSRIHAFLHRQEGDLSNARYWYDQAGAQMPALSLEEEWEKLAEQAISG